MMWTFLNSLPQQSQWINWPTHVTHVRQREAKTLDLPGLEAVAGPQWNFPQTAASGLAHSFAINKFAIYFFVLESLLMKLLENLT